MPRNGKSMTLLTAACLLLAGTMPLQPQTASAASAVQPATLSEAAAVQKARELLTIPENKYKLENAEYFEEPHFIGLPDTKLWLLVFEQSEDVIAVVIDAVSGRLLYFDNGQLEEPDEHQQYLSPAEAETAAVKFLQQHAPEEFRQAKLQAQDMAGGLEHSFSYYRMVNGIPVSQQGLYVTVGWDGKINSFIMQWEPSLQFPSPEGVLAPEKARQTFVNNIDIELQYEHLYSDAPELVYKPYFPYGEALNAITGAMSTIQTSYLNPPKVPSTEPLVKNGPKTPPKLSAPLTKVQAQTLAQTLGLLPEGAEYVENEYEEYEDGEWYLTFETAGDPVITYTVRLDANTGELIEFFSDDEAEPEFDQAPDMARLQQIALEKAKTLFPHRTGALAMEPPVDSESTLFTFNFLVNGLLASGDYLDLRLNPADGSVLEVYRSFSEADAFPDPKAELTPEQAKEMFAKLPLQLYYGFEQTEDGLLKSTPGLYYRFQQLYPSEVAIDARTGQVKGMISPNGVPMPYDIHGHWAEEALTLFSDKQLLHTDDMNALPDEPITRSYLIELMIGHLQHNPPTDQTIYYQDVTPDHPSFYAISAAAKLGWIAKDKNFRPDDLITREEMAILMAKAAGLDPKPHQKDPLPYVDAQNISWWSYGAVALNYKQGWMQGDDENKFLPQGDLTLAEAVSMLYRFKH
ncbi:hypothetical protein CBW65_00520 [Tumebacillus avium]|uniref:SLH domain-containing protein n=1 Tax=Tumebacillus avium TaxID=1903704 RepID=A0A1Y0IGT5_9BACL|nr:S-layer homology domain-containing protein [Tumebacillus avium]ARU59692.1 hypothetical protein CBW65_00520 [Tumebacillus avium]